MAEQGTNRTYELPAGSPFGNHGKTPASWALVWGVCLGLVVVGLGLMMWEMWVVGAGAVVVVISLLASLVMRGMGMGQPTDSGGRRSGSDDWYA